MLKVTPYFFKWLAPTLTIGLMFIGSGYLTTANAGSHSSSLSNSPSNSLSNPKSVAEFTAESDWNSRTIYEIHVRQYSAAGDLNAVTQDLPRIKSLGVGTIWLMPIQPLGIQGRKGTLGSPYAIRDYTAVNPDMGTIVDLRLLVNQAHALDIKVILDWVANHTAWDHIWTLNNKDFFTHDGQGRFVSPVPDWSDVIDLDYSSSNLRREMIEAMRYWLSTGDVDGFRCDVASMVPTDFWYEARAQLDNVKSVFMLAESDSPDLTSGAFNATYNFQVHKAMRRVAKGEMSVDQLWSTMMSEYQRFPTAARLMNFTNNHDENSWAGTNEQLYGRATEAFMTFIFSIPGIPLIYNGEESGLDKQLKFFDKDQIIWREHPFRQLYTKLNGLRKQFPIMQSTWEHLQRVPTQSPGDGVLAFTYKPEFQVLVVLNFSDKLKTFKLDSVANGVFLDYLTNESFEIKEGDLLKLAPWQSRIFLRR